jgi:hypothetical protein
MPLRRRSLGAATCSTPPAGRQRSGQQHQRHRDHHGDRFDKDQAPDVPIVRIGPSDAFIRQLCSLSGLRASLISVLIWIKPLSR